MRRIIHNGGGHRLLHWLVIGGFAASIGELRPALAYDEIDWSATPFDHRGQNGQTFSYYCPPIATLPVAAGYGTDIYTDSSSICAAAVHAGRITQAGGLVVIEIRPGQNSYQGSTRNGTTTSNLDSFGGSFVFVHGVTPPNVQPTGGPLPTPTATFIPTPTPVPTGTQPGQAQIPITSIAGYPASRRVDNPPENAIDRNLQTYTWTTEEFNIISPSYLVATFVGRPVERIRLWKKEDGGGGLNIKDLTIEYTTDVGPIESRTWQRVTGLTNGYLGAEILNATSVKPDGTVIGDIHDSTESGWASLTFDPVSATGIRIGFMNPGPTNACTGRVSGGACNHYMVYEIELY